MASRRKPRTLVVDASVLSAFYLPAEPYKEQALALLAAATAGQARLLVPTLTRYEVLNALSRAVRGCARGLAFPQGRPRKTSHPRGIAPEEVP